MPQLFCLSDNSQSEIGEYLAHRLPETGGMFLQAESEIAVVYMLYGAAGCGARAFTSSSSPPISLMSEGISYLVGAQLPVVFVNIMRGGTAYCLVLINDRPIGSPIVKKPLHLVAMNRPSLEKFAPILKPNGTVLINTTLIPVDTGRDESIL